MFRIKSYTCQRCSEGTNTTLCAPGPRTTEQWPHKRQSQTCLWVSRCLCRQWPATRSGVLNTRAGRSPWKEDAITPTVVGLQAKPREWTQYHSSTENWIKDLLSMAPSIRIRPRFAHSQSLPSGSFNNPLILLHQRADRMKTTITEN